MNGSQGAGKSLKTRAGLNLLFLLTTAIRIFETVHVAAVKKGWNGFSRCNT